MREIKFRGKRLDSNEWVHGGFHKHQKVTPAPFAVGKKPQESDYAYLIIESGFSDWNMPRPLLAHLVDPATVGQYTGFRDKNGVEIYNGDILKYYPCNTRGFNLTGIGYVSAPNVGAVLLYFKNGSPYTYLAEIYHVCEVIGNIYDNPELLK